MRRPIIPVLLLVPIGWAGCSSDRGTFETEPGQLGEGDAGERDAGCTGVVCSRDLHSVLDCYGNLVETCAADKACGNGKCVAPCEAAALNEGSVGCSFVVPKQNSASQWSKSCTAIFVANTWTTPATLRLEYEGQERPLDGAVWVPRVKDGVLEHQKLEGAIPAGGGAVVFVSSEPNPDNEYWIGCPEGVKPVFEKEGTIPSTGVGSLAFAHADVPVSMYSIYPYGGASTFVPSATLLLPTTSFRKNYIAVSTWGGRGDSFALPGRPFSEHAAIGAGAPTLQIVATEDDTAIDFLPTVDVVGGGDIPRSARNEVARYTLQRGQVIQLTQISELAGSVIEANKPVGVFGGHSCVNVPSNARACDVDNEQLPPVSAWGSEYAVVPAPNRLEWQSQEASVERDLGVIRVVGAVDGTALTYEPYTPEGAPATLASGQLVRFATASPFVIRSQDTEHPFYVATVMAGCDMSTTGLGDPETAVAVPTAQWLDSYMFFADFTYDLSAVAVTRRKVNGQFQDVTLDCAGALTGWRPIAADYEWTLVELSRYGRAVPYPTGSCTDGAHRIQSPGPFAITAWGIGPAASYGYAGGTGLRTITEVHVPAVVH